MARDDFSHPYFGSPASVQAARMEEIRRLYPGLTEEQVEQKAMAVPPASGPSRRQLERRAAQDRFETELQAMKETR